VQIYKNITKAKRQNLCYKTYLEPFIAGKSSGCGSNIKNGIRKINPCTFCSARFLDFGFCKFRTPDL
jgi:hypothetical protein